MSQGSEEGGGKRTAPVGGTGTKPTAANNLDTEAGGGTKDVMDKTGEAFQFPQTDQNRAGWVSNPLGTGKFSDLEDQKRTDHMDATGGAADDMMEQKPGGSEPPGGMTVVKDAWDSLTNKK